MEEVCKTNSFSSSLKRSQSCGDISNIGAEISRKDKRKNHPTPIKLRCQVITALFSDYFLSFSIVLVVKDSETLPFPMVFPILGFYIYLMPRVIRFCFHPFYLCFNLCISWCCSTTNWYQGEGISVFCSRWHLSSS